MTNETTASQPKVAAPDEDHMDAMRELVSDFRKAAFEFGQGGNPDDHTLMMRLQQNLFVELRAVASQPKSIGDDGQFLNLLRQWLARRVTKCDEISINEAYANLIAFIDNFRAPAAQASATIQAVPEMTDAQIDDAICLVYVTDYQDDSAAYDRAIVRAALASLAATIQEPESDLTACANCLRPKCEHNGKLCPPPYTTHWHAWDYTSQPQPTYPEYAFIQDPVMVAEPVAEFAAEVYTAMRCFDGTWGQGSNEMRRSALETEASRLMRAPKLAAPMVADPASVAGGDDWIDEEVRKAFESRQHATSNDVIRAVIAIGIAQLAATVKAVPSEALDSLPSGVYEKLDWACRTVRAVADLGHKNPIGYDWWSQLVMVAATLRQVAPLADKTVGGE